MSIILCEKHSLQFDSDEGGCPDCENEPRPLLSQARVREIWEHNSFVYLNGKTMGFEGFKHALYEAGVEIEA